MKNKNRIVTFTSFLVAMVIIPLITGCSLSSYNDLGSLLDPLFAIGGNSTTWIRTTAAGSTELFTFGEIDEDMDEGRYAFTHVEIDGANEITTGLYHLVNDTIKIKKELFYKMPNEFDKKPSERVGSLRTNYDPVVEEWFRVGEKGGKLLIEFDDETGIFSRFGVDLDQIDPTTVSGAHTLLRFFNLSFISLVTRIPAYGGLGMSQYWPKSTSFKAILEGSSELTLAGTAKPTTEIRFSEYNDFSGVALESGAQKSLTDIAGTGDLTGTVFIDIEGLETLAVEGSVTYDILVTEGTSTSGDYIIVLDCISTRVPINVGDSIYFSDILPYKSGGALDE